MAAFKAHVKTVDMSEEMEADAIAIATTAIMEHSLEKDMASYVRAANMAQKPCPVSRVDASVRPRRSSGSLTRSTGVPHAAPHRRTRTSPEPVGVCVAPPDCATPAADSRRASQSDMARDNRDQLRFACSACDQALRRVGVVPPKRHRLHRPCCRCLPWPWPRPWSRPRPRPWPRPGPEAKRSGYGMPPLPTSPPQPLESPCTLSLTAGLWR